MPETTKCSGKYKSIGEKTEGLAHCKCNLVFNVLKRSEDENVMVETRSCEYKIITKFLAFIANKNNFVICAIQRVVNYKKI